MREWFGVFRLFGILKGFFVKFLEGSRESVFRKALNVWELGGSNEGIVCLGRVFRLEFL